MTEESICLYTNLFTLADKQVNTNLYVHMLLIWLKYVKEKGVLLSCDRLILILDTRTSDYLQQNYFFKNLITGLYCKITLLTVPPPTSLLEGCLNRYKMMLDYEQQFLIYLDVDVLIQSPLRSLVRGEDMKKKVQVHSEGLLENDNYGIHFKEKGEAVLQGVAGFSSGKFILPSLEIRNELFTRICSLGTDFNYYCLDQPLFNYAIYQLLTEKKIQLDVTLKQMISTNLHNYVKGKSILLDFCGEPGDAFFHIEKMVGFLCTN